MTTMKTALRNLNKLHTDTDNLIKEPELVIYFMQKFNMTQQEAIKIITESEAEQVFKMLLA